jgi:HNH endonuclease.
MNWRNKPRKKKNKIWEASKEELSLIVKESSSLSQILKHFGLETSSGHYTSLKNCLNHHQIDYSHISLGLSSNKNRVFSWLRTEPISLDKVLVQHSKYNRVQLKNRLLKEGLLTNICYDCGIGPLWNNKPLSLQLDHINGIADDHRLNNLRILCPNCHSQTATFAGKKRSSKIDQ